MTPAGLKAIFGLGATQIIHWGSVFYGIAVLGPLIRADMSLTPEVTYGGFSLALVSGSLISTQTGALIDRIGGRRVMALGSLACALGLFLLAIAHGVVGYMLGWVVIGIAMPMALYEAAFAALSQVERAGARRAVTYLTFMGGLASTVSWPLTNYLVGVTDWRTILMIYAAASVFVCVPLHLLVLVDRRGGRDLSGGAPEVPVQQAQLAPEHRRTAFVLMALAILLQNFISSGLAVHLLNMLQGLGLTAAAAVTIGAMLGPAQVSGRIGEMLLGGHRPAIWTGLAAWGLLPVAFLVILGFGADFAVASAFSILYGVSNGLTTIARGTIPLALFGPEGYGAVLGKLAVPARLAGALGPIAYATVGARFGMTAGLWLSLAVSLGGFGAIVMLWRHATRHGRAAA